MITIATNGNNDIYLGEDYSLKFHSELSALVQICEQAVKTTLGELVLQGDVGMPNFEYIWNGNPNIAQAENSLRQILLNIDGITSVESLEVTVNNNVLSYRATLKTIYGATQIGL